MVNEQDIINTEKKRMLESFVDEFSTELAIMENTLAMESAKILLQWVRDKLYRLQEDFDADL